MTHTFIVDMQLDVNLKGQSAETVKKNIEAMLAHIFDGYINGTIPAIVVKEEIEVISADTRIPLNGRDFAKYMREDEAYLLNPGACPKCGEECIEGGSIEADGDIMWQSITCMNEDCNHEWDDVYHLIHHEDLVRP